MANPPANTCSALQRSLAWCQGTPELPGVKRRIYYLAKSEIVTWPTLPRDAQGRPTSAILTGSFALKADAKWKYIDILPDKSQLTSEAQGELPSQTQLNKLTAVHPGVGADASAASAYINNTDSVFLVEDMKGNWRVVGCDKWQTKATVAQDLGQAPRAQPPPQSASKPPTKCPLPSIAALSKPRTATSTAQAHPHLHNPYPCHGKVGRTQS